jgi:WD40 repeat protein
LSSRTIRVFISSTFRDMHAERDHLARIVFPELRSRCRKLGADFLGFDLRWGVTEEEAEQEGALGICLREIERCRPFFVALLGDRFGWVPPEEEIPAFLFEAVRDEGGLPGDVASWYRLDDTVDPPVYRQRRDRRLDPAAVDRLVGFWESKGLPLAGESITAREIRRGVFEDGCPAARALFYLRKPGLTRHPDFPPELLPDFVEADPARRQKLDDLKQRIRSLSGRLTVREYEATYAGPREAGGVSLDGMDAFGEQVLSDLWRGIEAELGRPLPTGDAHQQERDHHERFAAERSRLFLGREAEVEAVLDYVTRGPTEHVLVVTGAPGSGKSALLAECARRCREMPLPPVVIPHFIGAVPGSAALGATLRSIGETLRREAPEITDELEADPEKLRRQFVRLLHDAADHKWVLLLIDGLDQLDPAAASHELDWLPHPLPPGFKLVVSTLAGDCLEQLRRRVPADHVVDVPPLPAGDRRSLVERFLEARRKKLTPAQLDLLLDSTRRPDAGLPLYLLVALEELCLLGDHTAVSRRIERLPARLPELFAQVLERLEGDHGRELTEAVCGWLAVSRSGLLESEVLGLCDLFPVAGARGMLAWTRLYRSLEPYLEPLEEGEAGQPSGAGLIDFHHQQLRLAAFRRYLGMDGPEAPPSDAFRARHRELAAGFQALIEHPRGLSELPHHLIHAERWGELERTLCDLRFVEAKCVAGMANELLDDHVAALEALPEALAEREQQLQLDARINLYAGELIAYAQAWSHWREQGGDPPGISLPEPPPAVRVRSEGEIEAEAHRIARAPGSPDRFRAFWRFASQEAFRLSHLGDEPGFCVQQAWNSVVEGPVAQAAGLLLEEARGAAPLLLTAPIWRPAWAPHPLCESTLGLGQHFAITLDGRRALAADRKDVALWDLDTGRCLRKLGGHTGEVVAVAITPDGRRGVSASADETLRHWDLETGSCLQTLPGPWGIVSFLRFAHDCTVVEVCGDRAPEDYWDLSSGTWLGGLGRRKPTFGPCVTPDGRRELSMEGEGVLGVRDRDSGALLASLEGHNAEILTHAITPDGRFAVSGDKYGELRLWDLASGRCRATLESPHPNPYDMAVQDLAITPDGRSVFFSCALSGPYLWDVERGSVRALPRNSQVDRVAITPDGRRGISSGREGVRVWNLESGRSSTRDGHDFTLSIAITPDGSQVVSIGFDGLLRVWDVDSGRHRAHALAPDGNSITRAVITPDGRWVLYDDRNEDLLHLWDVAAGRCITTLQGMVDRVAITPDGRLGLEPGGDLHMYDLEAGEYLGKLSHPAGFLDVATMPDSRHAIGGGENALHVWDLRSRTCLKTLDTGGRSTRRLVISPDGTKVLTYGQASGGEEGEAWLPFEQIRLWNLASGRCEQVIEVDAGTFGLFPLAFTPDGKRAVSGGARDAGPGKDPGTFIAFDVLQLWDLETGRRLATLPQAAEVRCVAVSNRHIAYSSGFEVGLLMLPD